MRKRVAIASLVAIIGLLIALSWWILLPPHQINHDSYLRITKGMTEKEAQAILGVPPGDYARPVPGPRHPFDDLKWADGGSNDNSEVYWARRSCCKQYAWGADDCCVFAYFDREGKVTATHYSKRHRVFMASDGRWYLYDPSFRAKLRSWKARLSW